MGLIPPLAIVQARLKSTRLPRKMLQDVGGHPLLWWGWKAAVDTFDWENVVIACPENDVDEFHLAIPGATIFGYIGDEDDVLGRFHACAHWYRTDPKSVIVRITPDDFPIDTERERCTLAQLDFWDKTVYGATREHIGDLFPGRTEINTSEDLEWLRLHLAYPSAIPHLAAR